MFLLPHNSFLCAHGFLGRSHIIIGLLVAGLICVHVIWAIGAVNDVYTGIKNIFQNYQVSGRKVRAK